MVLKKDFADIVEIRPGRRIFVRKVTIQRAGGPSSSSSSNNHLQLIFCHGTCASQEQYIPLLQSLAANKLSGPNQPRNGGTVTTTATTTLSCLLWDQVGCGQSPPLPKQQGRTGYSNEAIRADLAALLQKFADDDSSLSVMVGHSYAASMFLPLLNTAPRLLPNLCGCIFLGTGLRNAHLPHPDGGHPILQLPVILLRCLQRYLTEAFVQAAVHPATAEPVTRAVRADSNANDMAMAQSYHTQHSWADASELTRLVVSNAALRILWIHGASDGIIPIECAQQLHNDLVHLSAASSDGIANSISQFQVIDEASHMVMMEQPDQVADHVDRFLQAVLLQ